MPIYEYRCESCGHTLDALQKISDGPLTECPECGQSALKRLVSAPSFRLKGGGWYETDFKSDKEKRRNLADGARGAASGETKSEGGEKKAEGGDKKPESTEKKPEAKKLDPGKKTGGGKSASGGSEAA